jgi:hypothetical protein
LARKRSRNAAIGIDIGGTKTLYALLDQRFEVIAEEKLRSRWGDDPLAAFEKGLEGSIRALLKAARKRGLKVDYVGAGIAGQADYRTGAVRSAPNLEFLEGYPLAKRLKKLTGAKVFVANDSSANFLCRNLGGMRFEEVGHVAGVAGNASGGYQAGMGVAAGDLAGRRGGQPRQLWAACGGRRARRAAKGSAGQRREPHGDRGRCRGAGGQGTRAQAQEGRGNRRDRHQERRPGRRDPRR